MLCLFLVLSCVWERFYRTQLGLQPVLRDTHLVRLRVLLRESQRTPQQNYLQRQGFRFTRSPSIALGSPNSPLHTPPPSPASAATHDICPSTPCDKGAGFFSPHAVKGPRAHLLSSACTHAAFWQPSIPLSCSPVHRKILLPCREAHRTGEDAARQGWENS